MPLQPNQEIRDPHSPANWKAVADISAKHSLHGRCKTEHVARCEENFDASAHDFSAIFFINPARENFSCNPSLVKVFMVNGNSDSPM